MCLKTSLDRVFVYINLSAVQRNELALPIN